MVHSITTKRLFGATTPFERLDAEYSDASAIEMESRLRGLGPGYDLRSISTKYDGPTLNSSHADGDSMVRYIAIDSVDNLDGLTYCGEIQFKARPSRAKYILEPGDILVSNVRPNRNAVSLTAPRDAGSIASSGFTLVRLACDAPISQEIVFSFLKTRYAVAQLMRRDRGSMYPAVLAHDVLDTWIPIPPKSICAKIESIVREAAESHDRFFELLSQAESLLESVLGPVGSPPSPLGTRKPTADTTVVNRAELFGNDGPMRMDAEFFRGEYRDFEKRASEQANSFLLGEHYDLSTGRGLGTGEKETPLVKQAVLTNAGVNWSSLMIEPGAGRGTVSDVQKGDILLACTAHEIPYVAKKVDFVRHLPADARGNAAVADLMIIRPKDAESPAVPGSYLAAFLRSDTGRHQVQRCIRGLRGGHVYQHDLAKHVRVLVPDVDTLSRFEALSQAAEKARITAAELTATAVGRWSEWIESSAD